MSEKTNFGTLYYGNKDGTIRFGHLHPSSENSEKASVTSGVMLQALHSLHYMTMDIDGNRNGWTLNRCPGTFEIKCNDNGEKVGFYLEALYGDIILKAPNGRIRLEAPNIDIRADGKDNKNGVINIDSNESINVNTKNFTLKTNASMKFLSSGQGEIVANTSLKTMAGFIRCVTSSVSKTSKDSKYGGRAEEFKSATGASDT